MANNTNLGVAKNAKKDEFYTQLTDIEKEMRHYRVHFKGKTVLCNCDDPFESSFFKFFALYFNQLELKKLICTCYTGSPIAFRQLSLFDEPAAPVATRKPYKAVVTKVQDASDIIELFKTDGNVLTELEGNGDFRSPECLDLLNEADIVVTNPPFSLFREYLATLMERRKHFIIIGNVNAITYKEVFPLVMHNQLWFGASIHSGDRAFYVPDDYPLNAAGCGVDENGRRFIRVKGVRWYTNLDIRQRHEELILVRRYTPDEFPHYDNYDAIEVSKTTDIPCDYPGWMGVPITFLDKYCPDQFEIIGMAKRGAGDPALKSRVYTKEEYPNYSDLNAGPTLWVDGVLKNTYPRILIRNKHPEQPQERA